MAYHADGDNDGDIFIYRGGEPPYCVTHVRIDKSVVEIEYYVFEFRRQLVKVDIHDGIRKVGEGAFYQCRSLRWINLKSAVEIDCLAFSKCENLESVEFGDRLETIGVGAFGYCSSLTHLKLPSIITIGILAFVHCTRLVDIELSERLETIEQGAFSGCERLQRIVIPLKRDLFVFEEYPLRNHQFDGCEQLTTVDLVGGTHKTVASLHMYSWRTKMTAEIIRINQILPTTLARKKTDQIRQWMESAVDNLDHYKAEDNRYVKEASTLLELALWKAKLGEKEEYIAEVETKKAKVDPERERKERRVTCGAEIVIKNVFPFL